MAIEQKWASVSPQLFTVDGTQFGVIKIASVAGFKVKQKVAIVCPTQPNLQLQVKRVIGPDTLIVGPFPTTQSTNGLTSRTDLSAYTVALGAYIYAEEQDKSKLKPEDIIQAIYRQEPGTTIGVEIDDQFGNPIDSVVDNSGIRRLAVDSQFHAEVDVQVDVDIDGVYDVTTNPDPDAVGLILHERSVATDETDQTQRQTARRGTSDTDTVSADVSIHDHNGNKFDISNPLFVTVGFEKLFELIEGSKWMELANYDEIVPAISGGGTILTLAYKEDSVTIGEAILTFTALNSWSLVLNRYINEDDGTQLLDDDDVPLNLE